MTTSVLISGSVCRAAPESKVSKGGKNYVVATIRVADGERSTYWRATIFSESAQQEMLGLRVGDAVALQGSAKFEIWTPDGGGEPRLNLSLIADAVMPLRQPPKERAKKEPRPAEEYRADRRAADHAGRRTTSNGLRFRGDDAGTPGLDDSDLPF